MISVTRFDNILQLWQNLKDFDRLFRLFLASICQNFEPTLENLWYWPNMEQIIWSHCARSKRSLVPFVICWFIPNQSKPTSLQIKEISALAWSSLVERDEQLDRTNSQACMESCMHVLHVFLPAHHLGRYSLNLPLLKSSMALA